MNNIIVVCPKCKIKVIPKSDGTCPGCQSNLSGTRNETIREITDQRKEHPSYKKIVKAPSILLLLPIVWLLWTTGLMISISLQSSKPVDEVPETRTNRNNWNLASAIGYGLCDIMILARAIHRSYKFRRNISVSAEEASGLGMFTGLVLLQIAQYLRVPETHFLPYLGVVFTDISAILVIVTLLQGKAFGPFMLYPKKH